MDKQKELAKNTAIITLGKICTQLVSFLLLPLYTAILSISEYGIVDLVITYSTLLLPFITLALEQALFRFLIDARDDYEEERKIISTVVVISLSILICCGLIIAIIFLVSGRTVYLLFGLVLFGSVLSAISLQSARGLGDSIGYTLGSTISAVIQIVFNVILLVIFHLGATGMMIALFLGNLSCFIIICYRCHLSKFISLHYCTKDTFRRLTRYSLPLIPNQLSWWALNTSDRVIVQIFIGLAGNGLIAVANKFSGVYIQFSNIFNISWTESAAFHIYDKDASDFFAQTINGVYRVFLSGCCGIIVCMPLAFPLIINDQYDAAYGLIPIFMLASLFNVIVSLYGVIYVAYKKTVEIAKTAIYAASLNILSHLMLVRFIGIYAAAVSTAIGYGGMALYRYFHSRKYLIIKFSTSTKILSLVMIIISLISYYCLGKILQIVCALIILALSVIINKRMILSLLSIVKNKMREHSLGGK